MARKLHIITRIGHVFRTVLGFYQHPYSKEWDRVLNKMLDKADIGEIDVTFGRYTVQFEKDEIWIGNKFYAYGYLYRTCAKDSWSKSVSDHMQFRPKMSTMLRLDTFVKVHHEKAAKTYYDKLFGDIERRLSSK